MLYRSPIKVNYIELEQAYYSSTFDPLFQQADPP